MPTPLLRKSSLLIAAAALPALALAHPGTLAEHLQQPHSFADGFVHPFTGLDHFCAMFAVGLWSAASLRRAWVAPLAFAACLLAGALAAIAGLAVPAVEPMIALSVLVLGLLVGTRAALPAAASAALVGGFAFFHGAAHGVELGAGPALAGMLLATLVLHAGGLGLGLALRSRSVWWTRAAGVALAAAGVSLLAAT